MFQNKDMRYELSPFCLPPPLNFHTNTLKRLLTKSHSVRMPQAYVHMCRDFFFRDMVSELSCVISSC